MNAKMIGAAAVIRNEQGHILLVKQSYGALNWELPGGGAETGESIVETALREVREETGLLAEAQELSGVYQETNSVYRGAETDFLHFVFLCTVPNGVAPLPDGVEIVKCAYWPVDNLPRPIYDFTVLRIKDAVAGVCLSLPVIIASRRALVEMEETSAFQTNED